MQAAGLELEEKLAEDYEFFGNKEETEGEDNEEEDDDEDYNEPLLTQPGAKGDKVNKPA